MATSYKGVEKCYAIQAGREIRIIVRPEDMTDDMPAVMSKDLAKKIEAEMTYPGQIKVTVIGENPDMWNMRNKGVIALGVQRYSVKKLSITQ